MWPCGWWGFWRRRLYAPINRYEQTPPLARYQKYHVNESGSESNEGVGMFAASCITINLIMGSGFLALPKAFNESGLLLGTLVLFGSFLLNRMTVMYEIEVMCRAEAWTQANMVPQVEKRFKSDPQKVEMRISKHAFQMTEMCDIFGGRKLQNVYNLSLFLFMFATLWGYGAVFGAALSTYAPIPGMDIVGAYRVYVGVFGVITIYMSTLEIKEQAGLQVFLTYLRFLILVCMVGSVLYALISDTNPFGEEEGSLIGTTPLIRWKGVTTAIPAVMFALMLASKAPTLVHALEDKTEVGPVVWISMSLASFTYLFISLSSAYYFGNNIVASCNVNWETFGLDVISTEDLDTNDHGIPMPDSVSASGTAEDEGLNSEDLMRRSNVLMAFVAYFIVLFPAIDVTSVYPLNVMVLASNMMAMVYNDRVDKAESDGVIVKTFRIACAAPPILCALLFRDLTRIVDYAGGMALIVALVIPGYLNHISQVMCEERFGTSQTPYSGRFSSSKVVLFTVMALGAVIFGTLVVSDIVNIVRGD